MTYISNKITNYCPEIPLVIRFVDLYYEYTTLKQNYISGTKLNKLPLIMYTLVYTLLNYKL